MESNDPRRRNLLPVTLRSLSTLQGEDGEDGLDGVNGEQVRTSAAAHLYTCVTLLCCVMNQAQTSLTAYFVVTNPRKRKTTSANGQLGSFTTDFNMVGQ